MTKKVDLSRLDHDETETLYDLGLLDKPTADECAPMINDDENATAAVLASHYHHAMQSLAHELAWNRQVRRAAEDREQSMRDVAAKLANVIEWLAENPKDKHRSVVLAAAVKTIEDSPLGVGLR